MGIVHESSVEHESQIVWLCDPAQYRWVRAITSLCDARKRPVKSVGNCGARVIGYAILRPDAPSKYGRGTFERRVFYLSKNDFMPGSAYLKGGAPCEAVDPLTVAPGTLGRLTKRKAGEAA